MTRNKSILINLQVSSLDSEIFGDGARGRIIWIGPLISPGLSGLKDVLLVEGLTVSLISVSQLCDENLFVQFTRDKCIVHNENHYLIMEG